MNRTDRLYAIVEELRAASPRARSARSLAAHFEVSVRTIERDIGALQQAGIPIWAEPGRTGGYVLDAAHTLPPLNLTPQEAIALAVGLRTLHGSPFGRAAESALAKLVAVMPTHAVDEADQLAERVVLLDTEPDVAPAPRVIEEAITARRVLHLDYLDRSGTPTRRVVEPHGFVGNGDRWYLIAWCRLREAVRGFRLDRVQRVMATDEPVPQRSITAADYDIPAHLVTMLALPKAEQRAARRTARKSENTDSTVSPVRPRLVSVSAPRA
ncbi:MAG: helix-turn-helix transcriptional regulator [Micromonosporaceae bacterium]